MKLASLIQFAFIFIVVIISHIYWAKYRIKQWAARNDYTITKCKLCLAGIGPFSYFGTSGGQSIFKIEARNSKGEFKKGYARAGGFFFGLLRKRVEVKWENSPLGN
jgi:hypothetical protein